MPIQWIDAARDNLYKAANKYADIQREIDKYNKVFETYSQASPETQMRAASVMRQAINEYNWLKKQQEENAIKIYEAQQRVNYYKENTPGIVQPKEYNSVWENVSPEIIIEWVPASPTETIPVMNVATPWILNNSAPAVTRANTIDTNTTMDVPNVVSFPNNTINPTAPVWAMNYNTSLTPQYPNTTIGPVNTKTSTPQTTNWANYYWQGNVATYNWTWGVASMSTPWYTWPINRNIWKWLPTSRRNLRSIWGKFT